MERCDNRTQDQWHYSFENMMSILTHPSNVTQRTYCQPFAGVAIISMKKKKKTFVDIAQNEFKHFKMYTREEASANFWKRRSFPSNIRIFSELPSGERKPK